MTKHFTDPSNISYKLVYVGGQVRVAIATIKFSSSDVQSMSLSNTVLFNISLILLGSEWYVFDREYLGVSSTGSVIASDMFVM